MAETEDPKGRKPPDVIELPSSGAVRDGNRRCVVWGGMHSARALVLGVLRYFQLIDGRNCGAFAPPRRLFVCRPPSPSSFGVTISQSLSTPR